MRMGMSYGWLAYMIGNGGIGDDIYQVFRVVSKTDQKIVRFDLRRGSFWDVVIGDKQLVWLCV